MRIETCLKRRDSAVLSQRDLYSTAKICGLSSDAMVAKRNELLAVKLKGCPEWVRAYVDGYWRCTIDHAYQYDLIFGGIYKGAFYSTHRDRADYYEKNGIEPSAYADDGAVTARGHYWKDSLKPFFASQDVAASGV